MTVRDERSPDRGMSVIPSRPADAPRKRKRPRRRSGGRTFGVWCASFSPFAKWPHAQPQPSNGWRSSADRETHRTHQPSRPPKTSDNGRPPSCCSGGSSGYVGGAADTALSPGRVPLRCALKFKANLLDHLWVGDPSRLRKVAEHSALPVETRSLSIWDVYDGLSAYAKEGHQKFRYERVNLVDVPER